MSIFPPYPPSWDPVVSAAQEFRRETVIEAPGISWTFSDLDERVQAKCAELPVLAGNTVSMLAPDGPEHIVRFLALLRRGARVALVGRRETPERRAAYLESLGVDHAAEDIFEGIEGGWSGARDAQAPAQTPAQPPALNQAQTPAQARIPTSALNQAQTPAQARIPTSALSQAQTPAQAWIPTSALNQAQTPAQARIPTSALSQAQTPAQARIPTSALNQAQTPAQARANARAENPPPAEVSSARIIVPTSGSTGTAKPIAHTLSSLGASAAGAVQVLDFGPGDRWPVTLSLHHVGGLGILFRALVSGGTLVWPPDSLDLPGIVARATHVSMVPTQLVRLMDSWTRQAPAGLKCVLIGGAHLPDAVARRALDQGWPIVQSYGLTEMGSLVTATRPGETGSSGRVLPHRKVRISKAGEVEVGGDALFERPTGSGAWYPTGDLGRLDSEGRLHITGRLDNMFVVGGENVHPEDIERAITAVPGASEAYVVPVSDPEYGCRPVAFVEGAPDPDALAGAMGKLPGLMRPVAWYPLSSTSTTGIKVSRARLTEEAERRFWVGPGGENG